MSFPIQPSAAACHAIQVIREGCKSAYPPPLPTHTPLGYIKGRRKLQQAAEKPLF
jgi:hypothetical protein